MEISIRSGPTFRFRSILRRSTTEDDALLKLFCVHQARDEQFKMSFFNDLQTLMAAKTAKYGILGDRWIKIP
jgi:hypothetical protein